MKFNTLETKQILMDLINVAMVMDDSSVEAVDADLTTVSTVEPTINQEKSGTKSLPKTSARKGDKRNNYLIWSFEKRSKNVTDYLILNNNSIIVKIE